MNKNKLTSQALDELRALILAAYPDACFEVFKGYDPDGTYLRAIVNADDINDVMDVFIERLVEFQDEDDLDIYVVIGRPQVQTARAT